MIDYEPKGLNRGPETEQLGAPSQCDWHKGDQWLVGDYRIRERLGSGAFGTVFRATDERLGRAVALKVLHVALGPDSRGRLSLEARTAAQLEHRNICSVYEHGCTSGVEFIAMQYIEGVTLATIIEQARTRPLAAAYRPRPGATDWASLVSTLQFFEALARACQFAHDHGVMHLDIKPSNIMVDREGQPVLLDFGLARFIDSDGSRSTCAAGTPLYIAPERITGHRGDARTDVYSLAVSLYESLTLTPPFQGKTRSQLFAAICWDDPRPIRKLNAAVPVDLATVLGVALEKEPDARYDSASALADDIRRVTERKPVSVRRLGPLRRCGKWVRRNPLPSSMLASLTAVVVLLVALLHTSRERHRFERAALVNQAAANLNKGNEANQIAALQRLVELFPEDAVFHHNLGVALRPSQPEAALEAFGKAIELDPEAGETFSERALTLDDLGRLEDALEDIDRTIELLPEDARGHQNRGAFLNQLDRFDEALAAFERVVQLDNDSVDGHVGIANALLGINGTWLEVDEKSIERSQRAKRAEEEANTAIGLEPTALRAHGALGLALMQQDRLQEARVILERIVAFYPDPDVFNDLATALIMLGEPQSAVTACRQALARNPRHTEANYTLGGALEKCGDPKGAAVAYRKAVELRPELYPAHYNLAVLLGSAGKLEEAHDAVMKALEVRPDWPPAVGYLAKLDAVAADNAGIELFATDPDAAYAAFQSAVRLYPKFYKAHHHIGLVLAKRGQYEESAAALRRALSVEGDMAADAIGRAETWRLLGRVLYSDRRYSEAEDAFRKAKDGAPPLGALSAEWDSETDEWLDRAEKMQVAEKRWQAIVGRQADAADGAEALAASDYAYHMRHFLRAAELAQSAFATWPESANGPSARYNAACAAVLAAEGSVDAPETSVEAIRRWRRTALGWLSAEIELYKAEQVSASGRDVAAEMKHWRLDPDLESVRGSALEELPEEERSAWRDLWKGVDRLIAPGR